VARSDKKKNSELPALTAPRAQLHNELQKQIDAGQGLRTREINDVPALKQLKADYYTWDEYNYELLRRRFSDDSVATRYRGVSFGGGSDSPAEQLRYVQEDIDRDVRKLMSLQQQLELYSDPTGDPRAGSTRTIGDGVFIVHGRATGPKEEVARALERLGVKPIVLHEQANAGRTLIEKFEQHAKAVGFAIVLLTADDEGGPAGTATHQPRARQNVVFELGFFFGTLGRGRVCVLYEEGVELPSDIEGLVYVKLDNAWQLMLGRELHQAGIPVDLNRLL
jgi:predicted nucleotide-binding protein